MWAGKIAIIMYVFSTGLMFSGYMLDDALGTDNFNSFTYDALEELGTKNNIDETISADLIFGDFIAGVKVLFGIITGNTISGALSSLPFITDTMQIFAMFIFSFSSALLWIYVVAGRSL